jgi:hypothetical protein
MNKRLRDEFAKLQVEINEEKSRTVELDRGESFGFLGFDFRRLRSIGRQVWRAHYTPKMKKRTALLRKLKEVFRRYQSRPVDRLVELIRKRSAGKPHAAFDVAGAGNVTMVAGPRSIAKAMGLPPAPTVLAPALDPT